MIRIRFLCACLLSVVDSGVDHVRGGLLMWRRSIWRIVEDYWMGIFAIWNIKWGLLLNGKLYISTIWHMIWRLLNVHLCNLKHKIKIAECTSLQSKTLYEDCWLCFFAIWDTNEDHWMCIYVIWNTKWRLLNVHSCNLKHYMKIVDCNLRYKWRSLNVHLCNWKNKIKIIKCAFL